MAVYFGSERCDGVQEETNIAVKTYYNNTNGVKVATVGSTDIYSPYEAQPDVTVTPYYDSTNGTLIAKVSGKNVYSPITTASEVGNVFVGQIIAYAGNSPTIPDGWLLCDGSEVSKTKYLDLYNVIGTTYGTAKDSVNNFLLPKLTDARYLQGNTKSGTKIEAGLPNIKGETVSNDGGFIYSPFAIGYSGETKDLYSKGALYIEPPSHRSDLKISGCSGSNYDRADGILAFDASKSNSIYGNSTTVTPNSMTMRYLICYQAKYKAKLDIAMPDWDLTKIEDIKSSSNEAAGSGYTCPKNGYVLFFQQDDGTSGVSWTGYINGIQVFFTSRSSGSAWENTNQELIPVSKGDIVLTKGSYFNNNSRVDFIPCKDLDVNRNIVGGYIASNTTYYDQSSLRAAWTACTAATEGYPFVSGEVSHSIASEILTIQHDCFAVVRVHIDTSENGGNEQNGHCAIVAKINNAWKVVADGSATWWGGATTMTMPLKAGTQLRAFISTFGNSSGSNGQADKGLFITEFIPDTYEPTNSPSTCTIDGSLLQDKKLWTGTINSTSQLVYTTQHDCALMIKELSATNGGDNQAYTTCYYTDAACTKPIYSHGESFSTNPESYGSIVNLKAGTRIYVRLEHCSTVRYTTTIAFYEYRLFSSESYIRDHVGNLITYNGGYFKPSASAPSKDIYTAEKNCIIFVHAQNDDIGSSSGKNYYLFIKVNGNIVATACDPGLSDGRPRQLSWQGTLYKGDVVSICAADLSYNQIIYAYNVNEHNYTQDNEIRVVEAWDDDETGGWYRIWSNGWCEQGGYTCTEDGKFASNVKYVSGYQCQISLWKQYRNSKYRAFVAAESSYNNGAGNCGYDYIIPGSKTSMEFKAIMCAFNSTGSGKNHYYRQYWEAKGYIDYSNNNDEEYNTITKTNQVLSKVTATYAASLDVSNGKTIYTFTSDGRFFIKTRWLKSAGAYQTEILLNGTDLIYTMASDNHDATPNEFYVNAKKGDKLVCGNTYEWTKPTTAITSFAVQSTIFVYGVTQK